jgi:hypothetical protein
MHLLNEVGRPHSDRLGLPTRRIRGRGGLGRLAPLGKLGVTGLDQANWRGQGLVDGRSGRGLRFLDILEQLLDARLSDHCAHRREI